MSSEATPSRVWKKRRGDQYRALFGDFQGDPEAGYTHDHWWLDDLRDRWSDAKRDGFRAQTSDDFNIGVIRDGKLIAVLWMDEIVDDEPDVLDGIVASAGEPRA